MFITEAPNWLAVVTGEVQDELGLVTISYHDWPGLDLYFPLLCHLITSAPVTGLTITTDFLQSAQQISIELNRFIPRSIQ